LSASGGKISLVTQNHEGESLGVTGSGMANELVHPALKIVERLSISDIVDQHTGISTTVESNTQRLEALLASGIPDLQSHQLVVDHDLLSEEIGTNGGLVLVAVALVNILVHQRGLTDVAITKNDDLQEVFLAVASGAHVLMTGTNHTRTEERERV